MWDADDAFVLKCLSLELSELLWPHLSPHCYHLKGRGGLKQALAVTQDQMKHYPYVFRSDVKSYYDSINHSSLIQLLQPLIPDPRVTQLIQQSLERVEIRHAQYQHFDQGITRGSPLSPLLGAVALKPLDDAMTKIDGVCYVRYMDDWLVLCRTRHQLRQVVKANHRIMAQLKLKLHPDKTYIGRTNKGFDFLGFHLIRIQKTVQATECSPGAADAATMTPTITLDMQSDVAEIQRLGALRLNNGLDCATSRPNAPFNLSCYLLDYLNSLQYNPAKTRRKKTKECKGIENRSETNRHHTDNAEKNREQIQKNNLESSHWEVRMRPSRQTLQRHAERYWQLYEQGASQKRIAQYIARFWRWVRVAPLYGHNIPRHGSG